MNSDLKKVLPTSKTFVINEYFGLCGEVANPWPDGTDERTTQRYAACLSLDPQNSRTGDLGLI
jgi:hypothetical protein